MSELFSNYRALLVGGLFIGLLVALVWAIWHGRRLIATERTDAVFGNPIRALGGWHWVIAGVSSILLLWFYFSWDAARAFFPSAANELCQVAKVDSAVKPMRSAFPFEARLLRGTTLLDRERRQLSLLEERLGRTEFTDADREELSPLLQRLQAASIGLASSDSLEPATQSALDDVAVRIDGITTELAKDALPDDVRTAVEAARSSQPGWGEGSSEIPIKPTTERGARFDRVAKPLAEIASDYVKIRNTSPAFDAEVQSLTDDIAAINASAESSPVRDYAKQLTKILKRIDDGAIFPPGALLGVEAALDKLHGVQQQQQGSLRLIDAVAMPAGGILAGNTACSEQGSGRWLPKPSDTVATLARISDPDVGYKGIPLLWYENKPVAEMLAFFIPDWIADLVPGKYPRHTDQGVVHANLKSKVLDVATGNFESPSVPVPSGHIWDSIMRVITGLFFGIVLGVPLGLFMGLSRFAKGFFDPLIELYRPVPPLAWAPLILTIFGIQDDGKIFLLFMVAFAIMVISARTGATGTQLSKIHAAHSLGASKWQIIREVILPNSLPEILTGIRISIGVCWGTLVAAEMLAGTTGIGFVENVARKQSDYEIIWVTIILLGLLGLLFDLMMRWVINRTIPWRGKG